MKMCAKCGGSMKKGGATKKMAKGGVQKIVGMPGYNATLYPTSFKKGGIKKMQNGGEKPDKSVLKNILGLIGGGSGILAGTILGNREKDSEKANERDNKRIQRKSDRREKKGYKPISGPSFKKGGTKKTLIKAQLGIPVPPAEDPKKEYSDARKRAKLEARFDKRDERQEARQTARDLAESKRMEKNEVKSAKKEIRREKRLTSNSLFKKGGATSFGMLSVKAGVDKNPKPTAADRIAGAKMKKKMGGSTKKK